MTNIENGQNIIIEGCYLPESINELETEYLYKIKYLHIILSEEYIKNNFMEKIIGKRNIIENRGNEYLYRDGNIERCIVENKWNKEKCIRNGLKYFEIKENYEKEINEIYEWIEEKIK